MKILVTGGAGFIGSHLVDALLSRGNQVRVLDNFCSGKAENLNHVKKDVELLRGDCADPTASRRACRGVEVVYHEAAVPSVARSVQNPLMSHAANATATLSMLVAARDAGVRRFIYAGSSSVYGNTPTLPKRETAMTQPLSPYAVGKLMGEHYLRIFCTLYGLETLTLRYFNVFGPRQEPSSPYSGVVSRFVTALLDATTPVIFGDGKQSRDFTYVANVVEGNLLALKTKEARGQSVNVAIGKSVTLSELLAALAAEIGRPVSARYEPARPGDVRHSLADIGLARRLLGYSPRVDLRAGLKRTVEWYRSQPGRRKRASKPHGLASRVRR